MKSDYSDILKIILKTLVVFIASFIVLNIAGKFLIEEITEPLLLEREIEESAVVEMGEQSPDFEIYDIRGKFITKNEYLGKPLVIFFWNTWGKDSRNILDVIEDLSSEDEMIFNIVSVNVQEGKKDIQNFIDRGGYDHLEILLDLNGVMFESYESITMPSFYFIDKSGVLRDAYFGQLSKDEIMNKISKIIN